MLYIVSSDVEAKENLSTTKCNGTNMTRSVTHQWHWNISHNTLYTVIGEGNGDTVNEERSDCRSLFK